MGASGSALPSSQQDYGSDLASLGADDDEPFLSDDAIASEEEAYFTDRGLDDGEEEDFFASDEVSFLDDAVASEEEAYFTDRGDDDGEEEDYSTDTEHEENAALICAERQRTEESDDLLRPLHIGG